MRFDTIPELSPYLLQQLPLKCSEGLALAAASDDDGAVMVFHWCNKAFTRITGYEANEAIGQRGTILIGPDMEQGTHLLIIDKLMNWEHFSVKTRTNRKNGEPFWLRMTWTPLSDPSNGSRWWLCSLIELEAPPQGRTHGEMVSAPPAHPDSRASHSAELDRLEKENRRLHELAKTVARESNEDSLTGLSNRRHFEVELKAWIAALRKGGSDFALLYIDLDRFKSVNDTLGHDAGDRLLASFAKTLRRLCGETDLIARIGGDEFVILKPLADSALKISGLADDIVREMNSPFEFEGKSVSCSVSVGIAIAEKNLGFPDQIVADADAALYHAKANGRGRWSFFTAEMHAEATAIKKLASELLVACETGEFIPYFQPLVDATTGRIASAEVLVRWPHAERGLLDPYDFLDVAATMGILKRIDEIVFRRLREALAFLDAAGVALPGVSINVSSGRLEDPSFIHDVKTARFDPSRLTVEILESVYLERMGDTVRWALDELKDLGVTIAVDDFGTGHASVKGLLNIRPSVLKIDQQFIQPILNDDTSRALLESIMGIGKSLNMKIVAEGVETEDHARFARDLGCDYLQGFFFGRPMSATDMRDKLLQTQGQFW